VCYFNFQDCDLKIVIRALHQQFFSSFEQRENAMSRIQRQAENLVYRYFRKDGYPRMPAGQ
jgi:hypothetical protein